MKRIDAAVIVLVVTEYDANGRPIREEQSQPLKWFAAAIAELPAFIEQKNAELAKTDG